MFSLRSVTRVAASAVVLATAVLFVSVPAPAQAADASHDKMMKMTYGEFMKMDPAECMKMMDTTHKGYVTKQEFMKFQEMLFNNIPKKNPDRVTEDEFVHQIHTAP